MSIFNLKILNSIRCKYYPWILLIISIIFALIHLLSYIPQPDEWGYFHDTIIISQFIENFKWFGNEMVGMHGFLFKIPPALALIITGPTIYIPMIFHSILSVVSVVLFYKIALQLFQSDKWAFLSTLVFLSSSLFLIYSFSYLRESPSIFTILLLVYLIIKNYHIAIIGLSLLLVFDAKEYVGFLILSGLSVFYLFLIFVESNGISFKFFYKYFVKIIVLIIPVFVYFLLMYTSSIVPENSFATTQIFRFSSTNQQLGTFSPYKLSTELTRIGVKVKYLPQSSLDKKESEFLKKNNEEKYFEVKSRIKFVNEPKKKSILVSKEKKLQEASKIEIAKKNDLSKNETAQKKAIIVSSNEITSQSNHNKSVLDSLKSPDIITKESNTLIFEKARELNIAESSSSLNNNKIQSQIIQNKRNDIATKGVKVSQEIAKKKQFADVRDSIENVSGLEKKSLDNNKKVPISDGGESKKELSYGLTDRINKFLNHINLLFHKILLEKTFNFETFPIFIIVACLIVSVTIFRVIKKNPYLLLPLLILLPMLAFFVMRPTHARYFLPASFSVSILLIYFIKESIEKRNNILILTIISTPLTIIQFFFIQSEFSLKFIPTIALISLLFFSFFTNEILRKRLLYCFLFLFISFNIIYSIMNLEPRLNSIPNFGYEKRMKSIASVFDTNNSNIYFYNKSIPMIKFYNKDINTGFAHPSLERSSLLSKEIPKMYLNSYYHPNFFSLDLAFRHAGPLNWESLFKFYINPNGINRIAILTGLFNENDYNLELNKYKDFDDYFGNKKMNFDDYMKLLISNKPYWIEIQTLHNFDNGTLFYLFNVNPQ